MIASTQRNDSMNTTYTHKAEQKQKYRQYIWHQYHTRQSYSLRRHTWHRTFYTIWSQFTWKFKTKMKLTISDNIHDTYSKHFHEDLFVTKAKELSSCLTLTGRAKMLKIKAAPILRLRVYYVYYNRLCCNSVIIHSVVLTVARTLSLVLRSWH